MGGSPHIYFDGSTELRGELYEPTGPHLGRAVLVVHEADGIGGNVRRRCAQLAELGYTALAADMHGGGRVLDGEEMKHAIHKLRNDPSFVRQRVRAGLDALASLTQFPYDAIVAIGYCLGGYAVLELARSGAPLRAVASFHGLLKTGERAIPGAVAARIAIFTGAKDPLVPPEDVATFQREMMEADADWQMTVYGRALHSFTNQAVDALGDPVMRYDEEADRHSWSGMVDFFNGCFSQQPAPISL